MNIKTILIVSIMIVTLTKLYACPNISVDYMVPGYYNQTTVALRINGTGANTYYSGTSTFEFILKTEGYPDRASTQTVTYTNVRSGGVDVVVTLLSACNYTVKAHFGCGTAEVSFKTDQPVNTTYCADSYEIPTKPFLHTDSITGTSAMLQYYAIDYYACFTETVSFFYRIKGQPSEYNVESIYTFNEGNVINNNNGTISYNDSCFLRERTNWGNNYTVTDLLPGTEYELFTRIALDWHARPTDPSITNCDPYRTGNVSNGSLIVFSEPVTFKTVGMCDGSKNGSFNAGEITDDPEGLYTSHHPFCGCSEVTWANHLASLQQPASKENIDFYKDTITSTSSISQRIDKHKFIAQSIELNPGFESNITNIGSFIASAFDPANCATANVSRTTNTKVIFDDAIAKDLKIVERTETNIAENNTVEMKLFPNPTNGILNMEFSNTSEEIYRILITDTSGREVFSSQLKSTTVDVSQLTSGVYFYKVSTNKGDYSGKLVKE